MDIKAFQIRFLKWKSDAKQNKLKLISYFELKDFIADRINTNRKPIQQKKNINKKNGHDKVK